MEIIKENKKEISKIITALKNGAVLVSPTDTVYGLICDAGNEKAIEKIFLIKKRDKSRSLLTFVRNIDDVEKIALINKNHKKFLKNVWPGQITVIFKAKDGLSSLISKNGTVGTREPNHKFLKLILEKFGKPLAQTSANIVGNGATTRIEEVLEQFKEQKFQPDIIIDAGDLPNREPSTIIDITGDKIKTLRR